jgi:hypothetical protein
MAYLNQMNFAYFFRTHKGALRRTIENEMRITYWGGNVQTADIRAPSPITDNNINFQIPKQTLR